MAVGNRLRSTHCREFLNRLNDEFHHHTCAPIFATVWFRSDAHFFYHQERNEGVERGYQTDEGNHYAQTVILVL